MINAPPKSNCWKNKWMERADWKSKLTCKRYNDIDSTYEDFESSEEEDELKINKKSKSKKQNEDEEKVKNTKEDEVANNNDDDEFNVSLAKMEEEIKPKIISILDSLNKNYSKLKKYQIEKLECC